MSNKNIKILEIIFIFFYDFKTKLGKIRDDETNSTENINFKIGIVFLHTTRKFSDLTFQNHIEPCTCADPEVFSFFFSYMYKWKGGCYRAVYNN